MVGGKIQKKTNKHTACSQRVIEQGRNMSKVREWSMEMVSEGF